MGYSTDFTGALTFTEELKTSDICYLNTILGEDFRVHPEWPKELLPDGYYIDLELLDDFKGLKWSGAEKTYDMVGIINFIIDMVQLQKPDFGLDGTLLAQGGEMDDRYEISIVNGRAVRKDIPTTGDKITCPHCEGTFILK